MVLFSEAESEEWFAWKLNSSQMAEFLPFSLARGQSSHLTPGSCHQHVIEGNGGWQRWSWVTEPISCQMWRHLIWHICHEGWWELSGSSAICRLMSRNALEEEWGWKRRGRGGWMDTRGGEAGAVVSTLSTLCQHYQHRALCTVQCAQMTWEIYYSNVLHYHYHHHRCRGGHSCVNIIIFLSTLICVNIISTGMKTRARQFTNPPKQTGDRYNFKPYNVTLGTQRVLA